MVHAATVVNETLAGFYSAASKMVFTVKIEGARSRISHFPSVLVRSRCINIFRARVRGCHSSRHSMIDVDHVRSLLACDPCRCSLGALFYGISC
jgi:hypothetical protein